MVEIKKRNLAMSSVLSLQSVCYKQGILVTFSGSLCIFRTLSYCLCLNLDELQVFRMLLYFNSFFVCLFIYFNYRYKRLQNKLWKEIWWQYFENWPVWSQLSCVFSLDGTQRFVNAAEGVGQSEKAAIFNVSFTCPSQIGTDNLCHFNKTTNSRENSFLVFRV